MQLSEHFYSSEFDCKGENCYCGGRGQYMNPLLIKLLEKLREDIGGYPLIITSGYRCSVHNRECGGALSSQHLYFNAADVLCPEELSYYEFISSCRYCKLADGRMFDGIGSYPNQYFVHVDVRNNGQGPRVEW